MADNEDYLKYDAKSMVDFLKEKVKADGKYTDQVYAGSNITILIETIAAMFECLTYNLNFQSSEATFSGVQIYENMLKIVNMLGYKARASIPSTIHGTLSANIYLDKVMPQLTPSMTNLSDLVTGIQSAITTVSNPKIISRDLCFTDPMSSARFTILENAQVYPEFINVVPECVFYWTNQSYTNESEMILRYLAYIWGIEESLTLSTTLEDLRVMAGVETITEMIQKYKTVPSGAETVEANLRVSSNDVDNFIVAINGSWSSHFITSTTSGEQNETYNVSAIKVGKTNISDGTLYAAVYSPTTIEENGIQIYKAVSSLKNCTASEKAFEYYVDVDRSITIRFGDGAYGATLPQNHSLTLFYIVNDGKLGEVSKSVFEDNITSVGVGTVLQKTSDSNVDRTMLMNRFIYDNIDVEEIDKSNCNLIAKLVSSQNSSDAYTPKMNVFFHPTTSASKFQDIETVDYIRVAAPQYNRTNDRIITKGDFETIIKKDFIQYVYDVAIMSNFEYMSKFYNWLYRYDSLSKDVSVNGYKFGDSCNFNDIYIWLKGYSNYAINDFIKKTMEHALQSKKILTSELVFLDSITTYFYPYVGNIDDDIDWLVYAREKYQFLIKSESPTDEYYKKWKTIDDLFDKSNNTLLLRPTKRMINYILSGESQEIKIEVAAYRDSGVNENLSTIKSNLNNAVNKTFDISNNRLGQSIKLNALNEEIGNISGLRKIQTIKSRNVNIYTDTGPVIKDISVYLKTSDTQETIAAKPVTLDADIEYPSKYPTVSYIRFKLDVAALEESIGKMGEGFDCVFEIMQLSTGYTEVLTPVQDETDEYYYKVFFKSDSPSKNGQAIYTTSEGGRTSIESAYAIYARCTRKSEISGKEIELTCYSNKLRFAVVSISADGSPSTFKLTSYVDDFASSTIELKNSSDTASDTIKSEPVWEAFDMSYTLSFAKFTNSLIDAKDFEVVGSGYTNIEEFCFPTLYRDITSIINVIDEQSTTYSINF